MVKVLIIRLSSLGDIARTYPAVGLIKEFLKGAKIDYLTYSKYTELVEHFGVSPIPVDEERFKNLNGILKMAGEIAGKGYHYVVDLHSVSRTIPITIACYLKGSKVAFARKYAIRRHLSILLHRVLFPTGMSIISENINTVKRALSPLLSHTGNKIPRLRLSENPIKLRNIEANSVDIRRNIIIAPFSSRKTKDLPNETIYLLIKSLNQYSITPVIVGAGENLHEMDEFKNIYNNINYINLVGKTSINDLINLLYRAKATISVDTSALYLASIMGKPVVGIFGPTDPRMGPQPLPPSRIVEVKVDCRPCSLHGSNTCRRDERKCMTNISVDMIVKELSELVKIDR